MAIDDLSEKKILASDEAALSALDEIDERDIAEKGKAHLVSRLQRKDLNSPGCPEEVKKFVRTAVASRAFPKPAGKYDIVLEVQAPPDSPLFQLFQPEKIVIEVQAPSDSILFTGSSESSNLAANPVDIPVEPISEIKEQEPLSFSSWLGHLKSLVSPSKK